MVVIIVFMLQSCFCDFIGSIIAFNLFSYKKNDSYCYLKTIIAALMHWYNEGNTHMKFKGYETTTYM